MDGWMERESCEAKGCRYSGRVSVQGYPGPATRAATSVVCRAHDWAQAAGRAEVPSA